MLISTQKNFVYTKTFKTASTSVEMYFEPYCTPPNTPLIQGSKARVSTYGVVGNRTGDDNHKYWDHLPAHRIRELFPTEWEEYFKFCTMRDPFDKVASGFFFFNPSYDRNNTVQEFRTWLMTKQDTMVDRDRYMIEDEICMDYFIRYETLYDDIEMVCNHLGLDFEPENVPELKRDYRDRSLSLSELYDRDTIDLVTSHYEFELDYFNYQSPDIT